MPLRLSLRATTTIPLELDQVTPERLAGLSAAQIERLPIRHGNRNAALADWFEVSGEADDLQLEFTGEGLASLHGVGCGMTRGSIQIAGDAGRHLGARMSGGEIRVAGNAGDWVGAEMRGGLIHVGGNAGDAAGCAYRGSPRGMLGGTLLIRGAAGAEVGRAMRRGLIAIGGDAGDALGYGLLAGTIVVGGNLGIRAGANMKRGTIVQLGSASPTLLPTFARACHLRPTFWRVLTRHLRQLRFPLPDETEDREFELFKGDLLAGGRGDLLTGIAG
ncbi:MAG: formylmethanofuran dehydrogenase subunit C [Planctomycetaceae bacterium]|nr:formylmethanofuran dehydrogenase subunit C [Planctomycetaceae bacterium]